MLHNLNVDIPIPKVFHDFYYHNNLRYLPGIYLMLLYLAKTDAMQDYNSRLAAFIASIS